MVSAGQRRGSRRPWPRRAASVSAAVASANVDGAGACRRAGHRRSSCRRAAGWRSDSRNRPGSETATPSMPRITSPAVDARLGGRADYRHLRRRGRPIGRSRPSDSAMSAVTFCRLAPSHGRSTRAEPALAESTTTRTMADGNGEADADAAARTREDRRVDADEPAVHVDQRAARIAGVDGRIGLDEGLESVTPTWVRASAETMPDVTVWPTPKGLPMARTRSPTARRLGIGERQRRERLLDALELQDREIGALVAQHDVGREFALVGPARP